jgi:hypothetical protein
MAGGDAMHKVRGAPVYVLQSFPNLPVWGIIAPWPIREAAMKAAFVAWVVFVSVCAAWGAFELAMFFGVHLFGVHPVFAMITGMLVLFTTPFLIDRPHQDDAQRI